MMRMMTVQSSYTITVTEVNDEPTLAATGVTGTFTEGGSNLALFNSADAVDSDSQAVQTFEEIVITVSKNADTTESLVIDGSSCALGAAATCVENNAIFWGTVVTVSGSTSTVTWTADAGGISMKQQWRL